MLCRIPQKVTTTLDLVDGADCDKRDMGVTTTPEGAVPPLLHLEVYLDSSGDWMVRCRLTPAIEGTNSSYYLGAGTYAMGMAWYPEYGGFSPVDGNHDEIYGIVDVTNSDLSRDAEIEHCNDWIRAHELTLKAAEDVIRYAALGLENRRFDTRLAAYKGARDAFMGHSRHDRIRAIFRDSLVATPDVQDFLPYELKTGLLDLFLNVGGRTTHRDFSSWHHFEWGPSLPDSQLGWVDWARARGRDYRNVQPSATFSVGVTTSAQLINL